MSGTDEAHEAPCCEMGTNGEPCVHCLREQLDDRKQDVKILTERLHRLGREKRELEAEVYRLNTVALDARKDVERLQRVLEESGEWREGYAFGVGRTREG